MTKSDVKKFLDTHRDIELSAERFEYSLHLYRDAEDFMFEEANKIFPRNQEERESIEKMIDEASSSDEIVKLLRKGLELETCVKLIKKAMEIEEETLPIIQKRILTTGQDVFIENALKYLLRACLESPRVRMAQSDFSPDDAKTAGNTLCINEDFGKIWRKICKPDVRGEILNRL